MPDSLLERTQALLRDRTETLQVIADKSGVGFEWLKQLSLDLIPDPSVRRVQQVHDYLAHGTESPSIVRRRKAS